MLAQPYRWPIEFQLTIANICAPLWLDVSIRPGPPLYPGFVSKFLWEGHGQSKLTTTWLPLANQALTCANLLDRWFLWVRLICAKVQESELLLDSVGFFSEELVAISHFHQHCVVFFHSLINISETPKNWKLFNLLFEKWLFCCFNLHFSGNELYLFVYVGSLYTLFCKWPF